MNLRRLKETLKDKRTLKTYLYHGKKTHKNCDISDFNPEEI